MGTEAFGDAVRHWRLRKQRLNLIGEVCGSCDTKIFPPRKVCPCCNQRVKEFYSFSGKGEIYSFAQVNEPPAGYEDLSPYTIAVIKLEEGPLVTGRLTDLEWEWVNGIKKYKVELGMSVEMVTRKLRVDGDPDSGMPVYGYNFRPDRQSDSR